MNKTNCVERLSDEDHKWIGKMVVEKKCNVQFSLTDVEKHLHTKNAHTAQLEVEVSTSKRKIEWQQEFIKKQGEEIVQLNKKLKEKTEELNAELQFDPDLLNSTLKDSSEQEKQEQC